MNSIAQAVAEGFKLLKTVVDKSAERKNAKCKEAAEKFIQVTRRYGQYNDITDSRREKLMKKFEGRFFKYN